MPDTQAPPQKAALNLTPLLIAAAACTMAMMAFVALVGPIARVLGMAPWQAGASVTAAGVLWMALAPVWGRLSDRTGRRKVLLIGVGGFAAAYAGLCLFVEIALILLPGALIAFIGMLIGRAVIGAFYAAVPPASFALIADHAPQDKRAAMMARLGAAQASGMVIGPAAAGLLAQWSLSLPLFATALLPVAALALLWFALPRETPRRGVQDAPKLGLLDRRLLRPMATAFCAMFVVSSAQVVVGFFALDQLGLEPADAARAAGMALTSVGVALIGAQMLVTRIKWSPRQFIRIGCIIAAIGFSGVALTTNTMQLCIAYFIAATGMGWVFPSFSALAANMVEPHEQGAAAGAVGGAQGLGMVLGPFAGAAIYALGPAAPYLLAGLLLAVCGAWPSRARA